jgi:DNA invertase Pin-like site-specific DNA recombinase
MSRENGKRAAIYARVSTFEQTPKNQLRELTAYARRRRFRLAYELVDKESGAKEDRKNLTRLMDLARKRQIDAVLVWKFDRFARSSKQLLTALEEFRELGVDFISFTENVDTSTPAGKALFTMAAAFAEFERDLIRERVQSGLARARAEGKRLGRPPVPPAMLAELRKLRGQGLSLRAIAHTTDLSVGVVAKYTGRTRRRVRRPRLNPAARIARADSVVVL